MAEADKPEIAHPYDPPHIERVLTPEDLAREVQYAGAAVPSGQDEDFPA
jgi:hypothetical protein